MEKSLPEKAEVYLRRRQFTKVISLLEPRVYEYRDSFKFYYMLGLACLYSGDINGAADYFASARKLKQNDVNLYLAQAVIFLRRPRGDMTENIKQATIYCLDALDLEPDNKYANRFLDMLKRYGDSGGDIDVISDMNHNGEIEKYYPPLPPRRWYIPVIIVSVVLVALAIVLAFTIKTPHKAKNQRLDVSNYEVQDKNQYLDKSMNGYYRYILTQKEAESYYAHAQQAVNDYDDNEAQKALNVILQSNCSQFIKQKALDMELYLEEPTFDSKFKRFSYSDVTEDIYKYDKCWVDWTGRVTNIRSDDEVTICDMLVGYEDFKKKEGDVKLQVSSEITLNPEKPIRVLARIGITENDEIILIGKSVYQPLGEKF